MQPIKRHLLILCEAIEPPAYSPRVMSLVHYLTQQGWDCQLVPEPLSIRREGWSDLLCQGREKRYLQYVLQTIGNQSFDLVFCSTYHYFPLQTASQIAQRLHCPLVTDLRDIREQWGKQGFYRRSFSCALFDKLIKRLYDCHMLRRRNRVLRQAAAVTTVSPWHQQTLQAYNEHTYCIYNGFDEQQLHPLNVLSSTFRIVYLGQLHSLKRRNPQMLFEALSELTNQNIRVDFYSGAGCAEELRQMAAYYHVPITVHGYVPREQIEGIMQQASILLILGQKATSEGTHGIMTTKFFEGLGVEKPQLLIESDGECLAQAFEYTNAGLAATSKEEIKQFISARYQEWLTKGVTHQRVQHKDEFTRQHQAEQFEQLFLSLCQK